MPNPPLAGAGAARAKRIANSIAALLCALAAGAGATAAVAGVAPIRLQWEMLGSGSKGSVPTGSAAAQFTVTNTGSKALAGKGWEIYFNCMEDVDLGPKSGPFELQRVVGPLYRLRPTPGFAELGPGQAVRVPLVHPESLNTFSLTPEGPYLVFDDAPEVALPIVDYQRAPLPAEHGTTPEQIYERNSGILPTTLGQLPPVFPTPLRYQPRPGTLQWKSPPQVTAAPELHTEAGTAEEMLRAAFVGGPTAAASPAVRLSVAAIPGLPEPEGYELTIDPIKGVNLVGVTAAGVARGLASLRQLLPAAGAGNQTVALPALYIRDAPRFAYRGLMLDVARNFQPKTEVLRVLDLMSRYKLNTLHFHLTDDEGWRIEIPGLPELTTVGAHRGHPWRSQERLPPAYGSGPDSDSPYGNGFYRRGDYLEILRYAAARHIEVIPEIELPGHARAAVVSMAARARQLAQSGTANAAQFLLDDPQDKSTYASPQKYTDNVMNPGLPSTYAFIDRVVAELAALHRAAGVPLRTLHVGGDELADGAWERSPACQALMQREHLGSRQELWNYFYTRVGAILARHGLALAGWEEVGTVTTPVGKKSLRRANPAFSHSGYTLFVWRNTEGAEDLADRLANAGYDIVLTPATRLYFDMPPYPSPIEPGQTWAAYIDLDTVFDYVPDDDLRVAPDNPQRLADREALTPSGRRHIRGLEGTLFSETVHEPARLDYMLMPRLLALAERAWAPEPGWAKQPDKFHAAPFHAAAWSAFVSQVGLQVLPRLDAEHAAVYRIPAPGLKQGHGAILVNEQIPGLSLRYTVNGGEPDASSALVTGPITATGLIRVAAFDRNGRAGRSSQLDNR